jgi:hypothetical protein
MAKIPQAVGSLLLRVSVLCFESSLAEGKVTSYESFVIQAFGPGTRSSWLYETPPRVCKVFFVL